MKDDLIFIPKYPYNPILSAIVFAIVVGVGILLIIVKGPTLEIILLTLLFLVFLFAIPRIFFRRITFSANGMVVSRYFLSDQHYDYSEIIGFNRTFIIISTRGNISLFNLSNSDDLLTIRDDIIARDWLLPTSSSTENTPDRATIVRTAQLAILPTVILWILFLAIFHQSPDTPFSIFILFAILVVILVTIVAVKSRRVG